MPEEVLSDLRERLGRTRWPGQLPGIGWAQGTELGFLRKFCAYWREEFDWRAQERRLNALPQFVARVQGQDIHFVHVRGHGPDPFPLILTHGWPSSFAEFARLVPLLSDPARYGAPAGDSFDVVVPSMPGYGFSPAPHERFASSRVPELWAALMAGLGYERFGAHGGDIGGGVSARLAQLYPELVAGIHVTNVYGSIKPGSRPPTPIELAYLDRAGSWEREEGAYAEIQATRPQTLAYGLTDSPAGLAAWIIEKQRAWSDCGGVVEDAIGIDDLLANLTIYWATGSIASSLRPYWDSRNNPSPREWKPVTVPSAVAVFPKDIDIPPREFAERYYNVQRYTRMPRGGHFPAIEQPEALAGDIRDFFRGLRGGQRPPGSGTGARSSSTGRAAQPGSR